MITFHMMPKSYIFFKNPHDVIVAVDNIVARFNRVDIICIHIYILYIYSFRYSCYPIIQRGGRAITIIYIYI